MLVQCSLMGSLLHLVRCHKWLETTYTLENIGSRIGMQIHAGNGRR